MKLLIKILAAIVGVIVLAVAAALFLTRGVADAADDFFASVEDDALPAAYSMLSQAFRAGTSQAELERFLDQQGMRTVVETRWSSRRVENGQGFLEGRLITATDGEIPVSIHLVQEQDEWRIHRIERPAAGLVETSARPSLPTDEGARRLADETARSFLASARAGSMQKFHASISDTWRRQYSVDDLNESYAALIGLGGALPELAATGPELSATPALDENGVLRLETRYPSPSGEIRFGLSYVLESGRWQALGLNVSLN